MGRQTWVRCMIAAAVSACQGSGGGTTTPTASNFGASFALVLLSPGAVTGPGVDCHFPPGCSNPIVSLAPQGSSVTLTVKPDGDEVFAQWLVTPGTPATYGDPADPFHCKASYLTKNVPRGTDLSKPTLSFPVGSERSTQVTCDRGASSVPDHIDVPTAYDVQVFINVPPPVPLFVPPDGTATLDVYASGGEVVYLSKGAPAAGTGMSPSAIFRVPEAGGAATAIVPRQANEISLTAVGAGTVAYMTAADGAVFAIRPGDTAPAFLGLPQSPSRCLALATDGSNVFCSLGGKLLSVPIATPPARQVTLATTGGTFGALALEGPTLYFVSTVPNVSDDILSMPKAGLPAGTNPTKLATVPSGSVLAIKSDADNLYYTARTANAHLIFRLAKAGGTAPLQLVQAHQITGFAIDASFVYFVDAMGAAGGLSKIPNGGIGMATPIAVGTSHPYGVAVDGPSLFFTDGKDGSVTRMTGF